MPIYNQRDENETIEGSALDILNSYGGNKVLPPVEEKVVEPNELLGGGSVDDITKSRTPHKEMIRAVLKMKPKDIHLLKKGARYFLDNPDDLTTPIDDVSLDDISSTKNSNDLADMLEADYDMTNGGEDLEGGSLLFDLGRLMENIPSIQKVISI